MIVFSGELSAFYLVCKFFQMWIGPHRKCRRKEFVYVSSVASLIVVIHLVCHLFAFLHQVMGKSLFFFSKILLCFFFGLEDHPVCAVKVSRCTEPGPVALDHFDLKVWPVVVGLDVFEDIGWKKLGAVRAFDFYPTP